MDEQFKIKTAGFEGPLDLLLSLIEKRKLFINDISLVQVTDDYIAYIETAGSYPIGQSAHFILIASTLILLKSKSLLPTLTLTADEEQSIEDLQKRLELYKRMKELSVHIKNQFGKNIIFPKSESPILHPVFAPDKHTSTDNILLAVKRVIQSLPKIEKIPKAIIKKVISLEEMMGELTKRITSSLKLSFREFSKFGKEDKVNIIVSFLAMLELVKNGIVDVEQRAKYGDIEMETKEVGVPNYS